MRIELHADDLGATQSINTNILGLWHAGSLDSVSVMGNGDAIQEAANVVNADINRRLRLVVHLNLSEGRPVSDPSKVDQLVDSHGWFHYGFLDLWILWQSYSRRARMNLAKQVEIEWREQIRRVKERFSPRCVSGVDGHIHVHMLPFLFPMAARLAREFALPEIRISRECFHFSLRESLAIGWGVNTIKHMLLNFLAKPARREAKKLGLLSPDAIVGVLYSGRMTYETALSGLKVSGRKRLNWVEVVFHPGRATPEEFSRWTGHQGIFGSLWHPRRDVERDNLVRIAKKRVEFSGYLR